MTAEQIIGLALALLIMCVGVAGAILPGLPSTPLVLLAAIGHKLYFGETGVGWLVMTILTLFTLLSLAVDYLATFYGAKKLGATWRGAVGAVVGGLIGLFFNLSTIPTNRTAPALASSSTPMVMPPPTSAMAVRTIH